MKDIIHSPDYTVLDVEVNQWAMLPPAEQVDILRQIKEAKEYLDTVEKQCHGMIIEHGLDLPGATICKGRTTKAFALDETETLREIGLLAEQMGIDENIFMRPKSPAELSKLIGNAMSSRLFIETTGEPTIRLTKKGE